MLLIIAPHESSRDFQQYHVLTGLPGIFFLSWLLRNHQTPSPASEHDSYRSFLSATSSDVRKHLLVSIILYWREALLQYIHLHLENLVAPITGSKMDSQGSWAQCCPPLTNRLRGMNLARIRNASPEWNSW